jgi:RNA polymerase sigma factor (sigma-70 family)
LFDTNTEYMAAEVFSRAERDRVVRLCARLSGSTEAAEDLAQETFIEAWRGRDRLRNQSARAAWLAGIARNVCRRSHGRPGHTPRPGIKTLTVHEVDIQISDDVALDVVLERSEVADLLSRALHLLPSDARELLVERYVDDLPVAEIAVRHDVLEGTAAVRLHRGKRALLRILQTQLREEAVNLGLLDRESEAWQTTRIWCPFCGGAHLEAQCGPAAGTFAARCPTCRHQTTEKAADYLDGVKGYWRRLQRVHGDADRYYRAALERGSASCACCGRSTRLTYSIPRTVSGLARDIPGVHLRCDRCGAISRQPDVGLALTHPLVQQFWRAQKRMRLARRQDVSSAGRESILIRFESVAESAAVEVVAAADTFEVLHVTAPGPRGARE